MSEFSIVTSFFMIFTGAAVLASVALYARQPLLLAYIAVGAIIGPYGLNYISDPKIINDIAEIGIIFLLFLLGLDMQPKSLFSMLKKATLVALLSSLAFAAIGFCGTAVSGLRPRILLRIGCDC